jgi:hypothetical protein
MKRIITALTAATALTFVGAARADDTKTSESKSTVKQKDDGTSSTKVEKKSTDNPSGVSNKTTDKSTYAKDVDKNSMGGTTTKVEKKATHDAPGMKNDTKSDVKETTETDAKGNVVKHEKTGPEGKAEPVK